MTYKDPNLTNDNPTFSDFGSLCPPPNSCESFFTTYRGGKKSKFTTFADFDPAATIENYNTVFMGNSNRLTEAVKFNIAGIIHLKDSLDALYNTSVPTPNIYFSFGAYNSDDADRYINVRPKSSYIKKSDIVDKICVLFAYKKSEKDGFLYFDVGTICPPAESCSTDFPML